VSVEWCHLLNCLTGSVDVAVPVTVIVRLVASQISPAWSASAEPFLPELRTTLRIITLFHLQLVFNNNCAVCSNITIYIDQQQHGHSQLQFVNANLEHNTSQTKRDKI